MSAGVQIRRLTEAYARLNADNLLGLARDLDWHVWTKAHLLAARPEKWSRSLVAVDPDGEPVAYAVVSRRAGAAHLHQIVVDSTHRGTGIGGALVSRLVDEARSDGLSRVTLTVLAGDRRVPAFYERAGFRPSGTDDAGQTVMEFELPKGSAQ